MTPIAAAFILALGAWTVQFDADSQRLTLSEPEANVQIVGELSFVVNDQEWKIGLPRDGAKERLALIDPQNDVQGYLVFNSNGTKLEALVYHRTRQFYSGRLTFNADVLFRDDSFPCRTFPNVSERVLPLASGAADSKTFDSLFAREEDLALRFNAADLAISSKNNVEERALGMKTLIDGAQYRLVASGAIEEASEAVFTVELDSNYFQKRWVPYYKTIDRTRCPKVPTGWLSWNTYFDQAGAEENLAEARVGKQYLQPFGCEFWEIESWQGNSDHLPVSHFYNLNLETNEKQFPEGMKKLADDIRALGFRPGIWTAPFATGSKEFYEAHKDWFLHDANGNPIGTWNGTYTLDPSNDEVIDHIRHIHEVASRDWGYEYFKIDGMSGSGIGYSAHFFERPEIRAAFKNPDVEAPFERCVQALREGIGEDRVFLACQGHFSGAEAAYADAARTGADIVAPDQPVKWGNVMQQAGRTLNQVFVNNIVFYTDPDNLLVNEALTLEEARVTTTIVALPGQLTFFGDKLGQLPLERMRLLQQTLPVCDVRPGALYPFFEDLPVWDLKIGRDFANWDVLALFNWSDEDGSVGADLSELGLAPGEYVGYEFWTNRYIGATTSRFEQPVPAHGVRLIAVHKRQSVPQFLSSDRHVAQGGVDLIDLQWNDDANELDATLRLIENNKTTASFLVPNGFEFVEATAEGVELSASVAKELDETILKVELTSQDTKDVKVALKFKK